MANKKVNFSKSKSVRISNDHKKKVVKIAIEKKQFHQAVTETAIDKLYEEVFNSAKL